MGITAFAEEVPTVGGQITLTQFLGADRSNTKEVTIWVPGLASEKASAVDKEKFFDISDNMTLTSSLEPAEIDMSGVYITAEKTDGTISYAFVEENGGVDQYSLAMSRLPHALYTADNIDFVKELSSLVRKESAGGFANAPHEWAVSEIQKAKELGIVTADDILYTVPISREKFCELAANTLEKAGKVLNTDNALKPILDTDSIFVLKLYQAGIINGKSSNEQGIDFAPNEYITREEAAAILFRMAEFLELDMPETNDSLYYNDENSISDWAKPAVYTMKEMEVMNGTGSSEFSPKAEFTGEQAVLAMVRLYECK